MKLKKLVRPLIIFMIVITNIGCDQVSKTIVRKSVSYNDRIELVSDYFTLTKVENSGAFLSFGDSLSLPVKNIFLSVLPLLTLTIGFIFLLLTPGITNMPLTGLCFVIGGGIGNIFDRIIYGSVTDFLHIDLGIFRTGIFNLADVSIMMGAFIILIHSFFKRATPC